MNMIQSALTGWGLWVALVGACLGTYFCRAIGVTLSQRINQDSEIFRWLAACYLRYGCCTHCAPHCYAFGFAGNCSFMNPNINLRLEYRRHDV
ncbi:hypothetical protein [Polynucleobacter necessarius]|uniref:hypothetical protein n=1 Tax=Polynucleobacter necessarius TaxID=576610 RepID=UPI0018D5101F|nr:hypothetical protein [Polynucleobacter necessarius]